MTIITNFQGGFGNHILNYFLCVYLSNKFNTNIYIISNKILDDKNEKRNDTRTSIYKILNYKYITDTLENREIFFINDKDEYLKIKNEDKLNSNLHYQVNIIHNNDFNFLTDNLDLLINYLDFTTLSNINYINFENSIVVSLRLGMGDAEVCVPSPFLDKLRLPFTYYYNNINKIMKEHKIDTIVICSDNYTDSYLENFKFFNNLNIRLCNNLDTINQFNLIKNATFFISSNSSFSIISGLLNQKQNKIICLPPNFNIKNYSSIL